MPPSKPPRRAEEPVPIADVLASLSRRLRLDEGLWARELARDWAAVVGAAVAAHTRPGRVQGPTLVVYVDSSAWLNELKRYGEKQMMANIRKRVGPDRVRTLRLQLDPGG